MLKDFLRLIAWIAGLTVIGIAGYETYATWAAGSVSLGAAGSLAAGIFGLVTTESIFSRQPKEGPALDHDRKLFAEFQASLPFNPTVQTLRDHDFATDYRTEWLRPLNIFAESWDDPNFEFLDRKLEKAKGKLFRQAESLAILISGETIPNDRNEGWRTVYPIDQRGGKRPQHVQDSAARANAGAKAFVPVYEKFVRLARKRLAAR